MQSEVEALTESKHLRLGDVRDKNGEMWTGYAEHFITDPVEEPDLNNWVTDLLFKTV